MQRRRRWCTMGTGSSRSSNSISSIRNCCVETAAKNYANVLCSVTIDTNTNTNTGIIIIIIISEYHTNDAEPKSIPSVGILSKVLWLQFSLQFLFVWPKNPLFLFPFACWPVACLCMCLARCRRWRRTMYRHRPQMMCQMSNTMMMIIIMMNKTNWWHQQMSIDLYFTLTFFFIV